MAPEARLKVGGCDVHLLGTIAGFVPDAARVKAAIAADRPTRIALGVPPEDVETLERLMADAQAQADLSDLTPQDQRLLVLLAPFGPTRVPSPDLEAAHRLAAAGSIPLEAIDLDDAAHTEAYTKRVGFRTLVSLGPRQRKLLSREFAAADAYDLALQWDAELNGLRALREVETLREEHMARRVRDVAAAAGTGPVLAIVPAARFDRIAALLSGAVPVD